MPLLLATIEINTKGKFARWAREHLHLIPYQVFSYDERNHDHQLFSLVGRTMGEFIRRRCELSGKKAIGAVTNEGWEGLKEEQPTRNGDCLHWGVCEYMQAGRKGR